ncbi:hypothetical protein TRFO_10983 [Tritrichomonas foetus]|uniref:Uncharacterized protein n=1 Tax=Tritrichomonas foetus TaxID=1144522 RepID=A0A1J4J5V5_9EUKA|nr:hypothetical protein TRFO_10983 [Tritrichomonas foetus]|eukprot:OHS94610.1 hypothetical protein TRFO_10983 [Tritrichomonas foetus]
MDGENDFSLIAQRLDVKEEVIEYLSSILPFKDSFDLIVSALNTDHFWALVDSIPRHYAMKCHAKEIEIPTTSKDFPNDFVSPSIQNFWAANCVMQGKPPTTINSRAISRIHPNQLRTLLDPESGWEADSDSQRISWQEMNFDINQMCDVCNSYISNGLPWLFLEIHELRIAYSQVYKLLYDVDPKFIYKKRQIENKLKNIMFSSSEQLKNELGGFLNYEVQEFSIPPDFCEQLNSLLINASEIIREETLPPTLPPIDEWTRTRTEALVNQMSLPLQQRSAFSLTPQIFQARMGQISENPFEPNSLTELLFSTPNGEVATMPFSNCKTELPVQSHIPYCKSVLRRFIARRLIKNGFEVSSEPCVEILSDVLTNELKTIAQHAGRIARGVNVDDSDVLMRALELCGFDTVALQNC